ncbi:MAG: peptidase S8/S53 domain-containing protein [Benniella sp.]|nr:MAG: peptidase S8/S53 domain-containing protein [Benniella sp.]
MKVTSLLSLVAAATLVSAGEFFPIGGLPDVDFVPGAYIIEFQDGFDYTKSGIFLNVKIGLSFDIRLQYSLINGMSIQVKSGHVGEDLAGLEGVKNVWPVQILQLPPLQSSNEDMAQPFLTTAHKMTGVDYIRETFGNTGKGFRVGIVDTGIDPSHPAFGKCPGETCRIVAGYDFIGDEYVSNDCFGHGTHVAGIIGADARNIGVPQPFVGVAPGVTIGAYKALSCHGGGPVDGIVKAMEKAAEDKMNIVNLSLGTGPNYRSNPIANGAEKLIEQNIIVVAAIGNNGEDGIWSVSDGTLGVFTTAVTSFDNIATDFNYFTYGGKDYPYRPSLNWGKALDLPSNATLVPILKSDGFLSDACTADAYAGYNVTGKVVLTNGDQHACTLEARGAVAQTAGALGMLHRSVPFGLTEYYGVEGFPMASTEESAADKLLATYRENTANTIQWSPTKKSFSIEGSGTPSDFSNWGLDGDLHIGPEISAPGGNILSTYPLDKGGYYVGKCTKVFCFQLQSGTSMSSPYVAGAYALMFNKAGGPPSASDIRRRFINTAVPGNFFNHAKLAPVAKQGGGLINVKDALTSNTYFSTDRFPATDRIELLDSVRFPGTSNINVKIKNHGPNVTVYSLSHQPAESVISYRGGNTSPLTSPIFGDDQATVAFALTEVTVPSGQTVAIKVQFQEPSTGLASEFPFYSGYIVATPRVDNPIPVRLPYAGLKVDISGVPMMDTKAGFPNFIVFDTRNNQTKSVEPGYQLDWSFEQPQIRTRLGSHTPELSPTKLSPGRCKVVVAAQKKFSQGVYPADFEVYQVAVINMV